MSKVRPGPVAGRGLSRKKWTNEYRRVAIAGRQYLLEGNRGDQILQVWSKART